MRPLRISAISYLNTAPLMWDFEHGKATREFDISYTLPSACARAPAHYSRAKFDAPHARAFLTTFRQSVAEKGRDTVRSAGSSRPGR